MQQQIGGSPHQQQMQPSNKGQNYNSNQQQWIRSNASPMSSIPPHHYASPPHPQQPIDGLPQQQQFITIQHRPGQQQLIQHHSPGILGSMSPPSNNMMDQRQQQIIHKGQIVQTSRLQNYAPPSQMQSQPQQQQQIRQQRQPRQTHNSMEVMQQPGQIQPQHHQLLQQDHLPPSNAPPPSVHHCYQQQEPEMIGPPPPGNPIHQPQHYAAQQGQPPIHSMVGGIPMGPASAGPQQHQSPSPSIRIRPSSSLSHMHPAPPPPLAHHHQQQQRILVHQQQTPIMPPPNEQQMPPPPPSAAAAHPSPYVGSLRFLNAIMAETDSQQNVSPKRKYRELKKKFKFLVYENEYYQEELRNLQRKLLKLSRDKNFLLDKLGQYENFTESSDDSDASTKTLEERGAQKTKRKQKQPATRKRAAPNAGQSLATTKRNCGGGGNNAKSSRKKAEIEKQNANPTTALEENTNVGKVELKEEEEKINEEQQSTSKMMEIEAKKETIEGESCGLRAPKNEDNFQQQIASDN